MINRNKILEAALMLKSKNIKYKLGAKAMPPTIPKVLDCSGFVRYCYKIVGVDIPDGTWYQWHASNSIKVSDLKIGDLGFKHDPGVERGINHIGIYAGDGKWIHCNASRNGITLEKTTIFPYARRIKGVSFTNVKPEEDEDMARKPVSQKELDYGIDAINNLAKLKIINSPERHIADLKEYPWDWKMWVIQNNIAEKCGGTK
ncbi:NlpC/P60 family protein [Acetoanaerobium noterae]|uniref:NlpC/P60 family protein n=1 Tax=Acetoanaerobium noterae TaxID=745369 RepID=A0A1T4ZZW3_9FIRM|nr:NlpC/P60 family protein [Acetoanaerobium noterae]SKB28258.1 NlpC/P60 family protein [Acetoanaerobium noterae]